MSNRAQEIIKTYYEEEAKRQESEITFTDYTVRLNASDIAMLDVIAKRFGKASERIASEAVSAAIYSMVEALETGERKTMAKEADDLNETLAKKAAKANGKPDYEEKSVTWVMNDRAITREENKRKKEQDEKKTQGTAPTQTAEQPVQTSTAGVDSAAQPEKAQTESEEAGGGHASEQLTTQTSSAGMFGA